MPTDDQRDPGADDAPGRAAGDDPTAPTPTSQGRRSGGTNTLRKYGPLAVVVAMAVVVAAAVTLRGGDGGDDDTADRGATTEAAGETATGAPEPEGRMPLTYAEADAEGTAGDHDWGDRCDTETGRVQLPTVYAAPCVPVFEGDNGGETGPGVTADAITVVRYVNQLPSGPSPLAPVAEPETTEEQYETLQEYLDIYASRAELYGREIELVDFPATGGPDDVVAANADAVTIAEEHDPFLVIGGPQLDAGAFAQELAARGVVCVDCSGALSTEMREELEPHVWGMLPAAEQFISTLYAWAGQLSDGDGETDDDRARFAGGDLEGEPRVNGVIHFDQDPPMFASDGGDLPEGIEVIESYVLDFATLPQRATELVARFKSEGVTTVIFMGDPIMPGYLMNAATEQDYFPEWVFTGTFLTDTIGFGRLNDPDQMAHAFGISQVAAPTTRDIQDPVLLYRWYMGDDEAFPAARSQYPLLQFAARFIVNGVHMAGPDLDAETFARGQFRIPPAGGGPTTVQISYGDWGLFPETDYSGIDDAAEIWWDPETEAPDEAGNEAPGVWRRAHGGDRFVGEDDAPEPDPFGDVDGTITVLDELPEEDTAPDYPPPPGSPGAEADGDSEAGADEGEGAAGATGDGGRTA